MEVDLFVVGVFLFSTFGGMAIILILTKKKIESWGELWKRLKEISHPVGKYRTSIAISPEDMKKLIKLFDDVDLETRLVLLQLLMKREITVSVGIGDREHWINSVNGIDFEKNYNG